MALIIAAGIHIVVYDSLMLCEFPLRPVRRRRDEFHSPARHRLAQVTGHPVQSGKSKISTKP